MRSRFFDYFLKHYQTQDYILQQKAKVLLLLLLVCMAFVTFLFFFFAVYRESSFVTFPAVFSFFVFLLLLYLLKKGHYFLAGHSMTLLAMSIVWLVMSLDTRFIFTRIDSISYVYTAFIFIGVVIYKRKYLIFFYLALNLAILVAFTFHTRTVFGLSDYFVIEYLVDNSGAFLFIAFISYQVLTINNSALEQAEKSIATAKAEADKNRELSRTLELKVEQRTDELLRKNNDLRKEINERLQAEANLKTLQSRLVDSAHKAGMADLASETLHNVGNLLNSVKTSNHLIDQALLDSPFDDFANATSVLKENIDNIEDFIRNDPKGVKLLKYYIELDSAFKETKEVIESNRARLAKKIDAISEVVSAQQDYLNTTSIIEVLSVSDVMNEALDIFTDIPKNGSIKIDRKFDSVPSVPIQKTKLVHVLVNLLRNALRAIQEKPDQSENRITLKVSADNEAVYLSIEDTGVGIPPENLNKIFTHGFTTKADGHGFGLHSAANFLTEMGASIQAESNGKDKGALFRISFPLPTSPQSS